jgi:hypothetical protein
MELILILFLLFLIIFYIFIYNIDFFKDINKYNVNYKEKYNIIEYNNKNCTELENNKLINQAYEQNNPEFTKLKKIDNLDKYSNFILIIDFPYFGGGTTFFVNTIISKYKNNQTFLILRTFDNNIHMYINDEFKLDRIFLEEEAIVFLYKIRNKITKIFINSIIGHSKILIDNLLLLNDDITAITHDYSLLFDNWHLTNINNLLENYTLINSNINIRIIKTLITQDINNLPLYDKYLEKGKKIIVTPLPDYKNKLNKIVTDNPKIVVGVLGNISNIKGRELFVELINDNLYDVIVFGNLFVDYDKQYPYKSIDELNELLIKYKPNIWIEGTLSSETYSYCLTLQMITELPILYLHKDFISVVENRLSNYKKSYEYFNIKQVIDNRLIEKYAQNYFYTISPIIYYNEFWNNYFDPISESKEKIVESFSNLGTNNKNIVLITSKIIVSDELLSYSDKRSIYTPDERYLQTLNTINSIRKYIPNSFIILIDNSKLDDVMNKNIHNSVDYFINPTTDEYLNNLTDNNIYKGLGEISQQLFFYNIFLKNIDTTKINNFFKISGRYLINENFNYNNFDNEHNIFKKNKDVTDREYYYTSFYKLNKDTLSKYYTLLQNVLDNKELYMHDKADLEVIIPSILNYNFKTIDNIGLTQFYSVSNKVDQI